MKSTRSLPRSSRAARARSRPFIPPGMPISVTSRSIATPLRRISRAEAASAAAELEAAYHASMLGTTQQVLFEQEENGLYAGHAMNYVKVYVQAAQLHNELRAVRVTDLCRDGVFGELE